LLAKKLCPGEAVAKSKFGVVTDDELLARVVVSPRHFQKDGTIKPGVLPLSHIAQGGLSLMRTDHMDAAELAVQAQRIAGAETAAGVLLTKTRPIREITDDNGNRSLCVIDDPEPLNEAHAAAVQSGALGADDPEIKRIRGVLMDLFGGLVPLTQAKA